MSQVRKLLNGNKIPKAQQGYKFRLGSQDLYLTDKDLADIDAELNKIPIERSRFYGNATNAIKSGTQFGNIADNTGSMDLVSGLEGNDLKRFESKEPSYRESRFKKDSYYAKLGMHDFLTIVNAVYNRNHNSDNTSESTTSNKSNIYLMWVMLEKSE